MFKQKGDYYWEVGKNTMNLYKFHAKKLLLAMFVQDLLPGFSNPKVPQKPKVSGVSSNLIAKPCSNQLYHAEGPLPKATTLSLLHCFVHHRTTKVQLSFLWFRTSGSATSSGSVATTSWFSYKQRLILHSCSSNNLWRGEYNYLSF